MTYNLVLRSEYSMFNSLCSLESIIAYCKKNHLNACTICDIDNMYGVYKFYKLAKKNNIKPVLGVNIKFADIDLYLYAENNTGYQNLLKIISEKNINKEINIDTFKKYCEGVLLVMAFDRLEAFNNVSLLNELSSLFSNTYFGVYPKQLNRLAYFDRLNPHISKVAIKDCRYFEEKDVDAYKVLKAIQRNCDIKSIEDVDYKVLSLDELDFIYDSYPELLLNTERIINKCNVDLEKIKQTNPLPKYSTFDSFDYLKALCLKGLSKRGLDKNQKYLDRLNKELTVINKLKFADYFLIVWDYVKYAKNNDILVGPGRGSAAASLVSYLIGITDIDPIQYNLLFERFLNEERITMPDIDIDFPDDRRDEVIKYVGDKYGKNRVVHIVTYSTFQLRSSIKDISKVLNISQIKQEEVLKCFKENANPLDIMENDVTLKQLMNEYTDVRVLIEVTKKLFSLPKVTSTHAAGIIIACDDITNYTPIEIGDKNIYQSQYDAHDLEDLGLLKMDFLGLKNLSFINKCLDKVHLVDPKFTLPKEYDDKKTLDLLNRAETLGIFQFESSGMRNMLKKIGISCFEDICQALALYRPGPLSMLDTYTARKKGQEKVSYLDPAMEPILKSTYGIVLYQEQIIMLAVKIAGYSLGEADILRRAISKKQKDVIEKERAKFIEKSVKNGYKDYVASAIYEYIYNFADYGFNRAHSVAYAVISYQMDYLKSNMSECFYSCLLDELIGTNLFDEVLAELKMKSIEVLSPSINYSSDIFIPYKKQILMPLSNVKGIGKSYAQFIMEKRGNDPFTSFEDFIKRCGSELPESLIENLIYSGAFDQFGISKKALIENMKNVIERCRYSFLTNIAKLEYDKEEYGYGFLLNKEKDVIGMNIRYNYMNQYSKMYQNGSIKYINKISSGSVKILGKITSIRHITTKKNDKMAFITLVDNTGKIDVVVFPSKYPEIEILKEEMIIIVSGNVNDRDNQKEIIMENFRQV